MTKRGSPRPARCALPPLRRRRKGGRAHREPSLLKAHAFFSLKKQGQRSGAHMGAGNRLITDGQNILGREIFAQQAGQVVGILGTVGVGDAHRLLPGVFDQGVILFGQRLDGLLSSAHLAEGQSLLIYGTKIQSDMVLPDNIEVKKIPKDLLEKCDFESEVQ